MPRCLRPAVALVLCLLPSACTAVVYVDAGATGSVHDGRSWTTAYTSIQQAINASIGGDIWIRGGVYAEPVTLKHTVNLYGGFLGWETLADQRLIGAFPTIIDGRKKWRGIDVPAGAWCTIDGIVVRRGCADTGAGVRCNTNSIVKLRNCRIEDCRAWQQAGGVYYAAYTQGEMTDCRILRCSAPNGGGGIVEYHSYPTWTRCVIARNQATVSGGGVYCPFHSGALLVNCTLASNTADVNGGAVYAHYGGPVTLNYCILFSNYAPEGGAVYGGGGSSQTTLNHCDFYANSIADFGGAIVAPSPVLGPLYVDPMFVAPSLDDYHLAPGSPCSGMGAFTYESAYTIDRIGEASTLPLGASARMISKVVSFVDGDTVYVQEPDRAAAIAVRGLSGYRLGDLLTSVSGTLSVNEQGYLQLTNASATRLATSVYRPKPLGMDLTCLERAHSLLARTWGRAWDVSASGFTLVGGMGSVSVRWQGPSPLPGDAVVVTGVYTVLGDLAASDVRRF